MCARVWLRSTRPSAVGTYLLFPRRVSTVMRTRVPIITCLLVAVAGSLTAGRPTSAVESDPPECSVQRPTLCLIVAQLTAVTAPAQVRVVISDGLRDRLLPESRDVLSLCVAQVLGQPSEERLLAIRDCLAALRPELVAAGLIGGGRGELDAALGLAGRVRPAGSALGGTSGCGGAGVDPRLVKPPGGWTGGSWSNPWFAPPDSSEHRELSQGWSEYQRLDRAADRAWHAFRLALEDAVEVDWGGDTPEEVEAREALRLAREAAERAIEERNSYRPKVADGNDGVLPTEPGTAIVRPAAGTESPCDAVASFLQQCASISWQTSPCRLFLEQLGGCDSTLMYIDPDNGAGCGTAPEPDAAIVAATLKTICWSEIQPEGPDTDPCAPQLVEGTAVIGFIAASGDICDDPHAYIPDDRCAIVPSNPDHVADVLLARERRMAAIVATLQNLCGCVLPGLGPQPAPPPIAAGQIVVWHGDPAAHSPEPHRETPSPLQS